MKKGMQVRLQAIAVGLGLAVSGMSAHAVIDTTAITTAITDVATAAAVVGAAVVVMHFGIKAYKWLRSAG